MKIYEIENLTELGPYGRMRDTMQQKARARSLAKQSVGRWFIQSDRLTKAGIHMDRPDEAANQFNVWVQKFFKTPNLPKATPNDMQSRRSQAQLVQRIVYARLAGLHNPITQPQQANTTAQPQQQNTGAPVGSVVTANRGKYTKTSHGWVNENGQLITKLASVQNLEFRFTQQQGNTP